MSAHNESLELLRRSAIIGDLAADIDVAHDLFAEGLSVLQRARRVSDAAYAGESNMAGRARALLNPFSLVLGGAMGALSVLLIWFAVAA